MTRRTPEEMLEELSHWKPRGRGLADAMEYDFICAEIEARATRTLFEEAKYPDWWPRYRFLRDAKRVGPPLA